jgi:hypothetical protein
MAALLISRVLFYKNVNRVIIAGPFSARILGFGVFYQWPVAVHIASPLAAGHLSRGVRNAFAGEIDEGEEKGDVEKEKGTQE